jgi:hypothetical protein
MFFIAYYKERKQGQPASANKDKIINSNSVHPWSGVPGRRGKKKNSLERSSQEKSLAPSIVSYTLTNAL